MSPSYNLRLAHARFIQAIANELRKQHWSNWIATRTWARLGLPVLIGYAIYCATVLTAPVLHFGGLPWLLGAYPLALTMQTVMALATHHLALSVRSGNPRFRMISSFGLLANALFIAFVVMGRAASRMESGESSYAAWTKASAIGLLFEIACPLFFGMLLAFAWDSVQQAAERFHFFEALWRRTMAAGSGASRVWQAAVQELAAELERRRTESLGHYPDLCSASEIAYRLSQLQAAGRHMTRSSQAIQGSPEWLTASPHSKETVDRGGFASSSASRVRR